MSKFVARFIAIACASIISASAVADDFRPIAASRGAKIGIVSVLKSEVANAGGGYTAFSRYNERLTNDWALDSYSIEKTKAALEASGFVTEQVTLDRQSLDAIDNGEDLSRLNHDGLSRDWKNKYQQLLQAHGLAALVVLRENPFPLPNTNDPSIAYGFIVSSSSGFFKATELLLTVTADAIGDIPPHRAVGTCLAREKFDVSELRVAKLKEASIEDLRPLRVRFESLLERKIRFDLASAGLLPEKMYCPTWFEGAKNAPPGLKRAR